MTPSNAANESVDIGALCSSKLSGCAVILAEDERRELSADIAGDAPAVPAAIVRPATHDQVTNLVRLAAEHGIALFPKGGGWSYTSGFAPTTPRAVLVDMTLVKGIALDRDTGTVTAGAGVTWGELYDHLDAEGLRVPSFGPLSGLAATVGGLAAQNGGFFGAAAHGLIGDGSVTGARVVDGLGGTRDLSIDDRVDGGRAPQPLVGDCGAFGIKTAVTFAVMQRPSATRCGSFAFPDAASALAVLSQLCGREGVGEAFVFDPGTHANMAETGFSLKEASAIAGDLIAADGTIGERMRGLVRTAAAGPAFMRSLRWSLHVTLDGGHAAALAVEAEAMANAAGGRVIPDTIPRVLRARPFRSVKALLGPVGELWLPCHGVIAAHDVVALMARLQQAIVDIQTEMTLHQIRIAVMAVAVGKSVIVEPQFFWLDALQPIHRRLATPHQVATYAMRPPRAAARAAVHRLRRTVIESLDSAGAHHIQIGRTYAGHSGVNRQTVARWRAIKEDFDPENIMNPGVLGL